MSGNNDTPQSEVKLQVGDINDTSLNLKRIQASHIAHSLNKLVEEARNDTSASWPPEFKAVTVATQAPDEIYFTREFQDEPYEKAERTGEVSELGKSLVEQMRQALRGAERSNPPKFSVEWPS